MKLISFMAAGALILFSGFGMKKKETPLYETKWALKKIHGPSGVHEVSTKAYIEFDAEQKRIGGNGSCNRLGGSFSINGDSLHFSGIFSTKMYCDQVQKVEDAFFQALGKVNRFELKGKILHLYKDTDLLLEFRSE